MITGETGTGKRTFAQCIHNASQRGNERFVMVDCAAYSPSALERELFGYEEGAVSGGRKEAAAAPLSWPIMARCF